MEYTTSSGVIAMPAHYALVPQEEMVYLEGGAILDINITKEQVIQFGVNVLVNGLLFLGGTFFASGVSLVKNAYVGNTTTTGNNIMGDFFSSLSGGQWALLAVGGVLGGIYAANMAVYYYTTLIDPIVKAVQDAVANSNATTAQPALAAA